jgi:hypothetical protein
MVEEHSVDPALNNARTWLRAVQLGFANIKLPISKGQLRTDAALERLEKIYRFDPTEVPNLVRRGAFRYDRELESRRIARAQALIRRVEPGPFEDPNYFAILAYEAASIEMAYDFMAQGALTEDLFSKTLLGTLHAPEVNAFARKEAKDGYTIVMLNSGLVDFIYQAAKAIVEAVNPSRVVDGRSAVKGDFSLEAVRARLVSDPRPAERLYRTLEAYFFAGYPRASAGETIPEEHGPVLKIVVGLAERWVIGHEYGHGLALLSAFEHPPPGVNPKIAEEYFADSTATVATVISAGELDVVPPEFPLAGAIFALACLDLLQRAFSVLRTGKEMGAYVEQGTHPKPRERATAVINSFRQSFDVDYHPDRTGRRFDLAFALRSETPEVHGFSSEHSKRAYAHANVLQTIWEPVKDRLFEDFRRKRPLHPLWQ